MSFNSFSYRLLLNLHPVFPREMSFTHLHMSMATKQQLVKLFAASSAGAVPGCWLCNKEMSGADFLHPTAEGKLERKGISLLKQDAQDSFSERREIPCISHLSPCTVTYCWPPPKAVPPLLVHLLTKQAGVWQKTACIMNAVGEAAAAPQHSEGLWSQLASGSSMLIYFFSPEYRELLFF